MKKKSGIVILIIIVVIAFVALKIYFNNSEVSKENEITYTKNEVMEKCFHLNPLSSSYIEEFSIKPDGNESDTPKSYFVEVKMVVPEKEINELFSFYNNDKKFFADDNDLKMNLFVEKGIDKSNFSYYYWGAKKAEKDGWETQRSTYIIFTKPVNGKVTVFLSQDKLGWN